MANKTPILEARGIEKDYFSIQRVGAPFRLRMSHWFTSLFGWQPLREHKNLWEPRTVLRGVDLQVYADEVLAITGRSGAGKSTFLHLLGALDRPSRGEIHYRGKDIFGLGSEEMSDFRNDKIGFVFQFYHLFDDLNAFENILLPARVHAEWGSRQREFEDRAKELLNRVGLETRLRHRPNQLSGGEQQRVAIARALLLRPEILLCDEPTGNLDAETGEKVLEVLFELKEKEGQTYVVVTHDESFATQADRHVTMHNGKIATETSKATA